MYLLWGGGGEGGGGGGEGGGGGVEIYQEVDRKWGSEKEEVLDKKNDNPSPDENSYAYDVHLRLKLCRQLFQNF